MPLACLASEPHALPRRRSGARIARDWAFVGSIAASVAVLLAVGCGERSSQDQGECLIACRNQVTGVGPVAVPDGTPSVGVKLCYEGECRDTLLALSPASGPTCINTCDSGTDPDLCPCLVDPGNGCSCVDAEDPASCRCEVTCSSYRGEVTCTSPSPSVGTWELTADWDHGAAGIPSDGKEYSVRLSDGESGETLLDLTRLVTFTVDNPGDCEECWHGEFYFY